MARHKRAPVTELEAQEVELLLEVCADAIERKAQNTKSYFVLVVQTGDGVVGSVSNLVDINSKRELLRRGLDINKRVDGSR